MKIKNNLFLQIKTKENVLFVRKIFLEETINFQSNIIFATYFKGNVIVVEEFKNRISFLSLDGYKILETLEFNINSSIRMVKFINLKIEDVLVIKVFYNDSKIKNFVVNKNGFKI